MVVKILSKSLLKLVFIKSTINSFHFDGFDQTKTPLESRYFSLSKLINESVLLVLNMAACHMSPLFLINSRATQFKASEGRTKKILAKYLEGGLAKIPIFCSQDKLNKK